MKKYLISIILIILLGTPLAAETDGPMDTLKNNIDKVLNVLRDPAMQGESAEAEKKDALRNISNDMFHWEGLSRRVLSKNWRTLNSDQQQEFIMLFKNILEQTYIDRILAYKDEKIEYVNSIMKSETVAEIKTHILTGTAPIVLEYKLKLIGGKWGVYDVIAEGASMALTFRKDYRNYLQSNSPADLIDFLRKKVDGSKS